MKERLEVLWLCNCPVLQNDWSSTGTWLGALASRLAATGRIHLAAVSLASVRHCVQTSNGPIAQWLVPRSWSTGSDGLPRRSRVCQVLDICRGVSPDLIHVWG